ACDGNGACNAACNQDTDCAQAPAPGYYCDAQSHTCVARQALGTLCTAPNHCGSGICIDQRCCATPCLGTCEAGDNDSGLCTAIADGQDPAAECPGGLTCDGARACRSACSGDGQCEAGFFCGAGSCANKKTNGTTCASAHECFSNLCVDGVCCD